MENLYPDGTSIKLVVHPQLPNNDKDPAPSITFTCNGKLKRKSSQNEIAFSLSPLKSP